MMIDEQLTTFHSETRTFKKWISLQGLMGALSKFLKQIGINNSFTAFSMLSSNVKTVLDLILSVSYPCAVEKFSILKIRSMQEKQLEMSSDMHRSNTQSWPAAVQVAQKVPTTLLKR